MKVIEMNVLNAVAYGTDKFSVNGYVCSEEEFKKKYIIFENNHVTSLSVDNYIKDINVMQLDEKTTLVKATLQNGYIVVETSSCADAINYDESVGKSICLKKIKEKVWDLLGFMLNSALTNK